MDIIVPVMIAIIMMGALTVPVIVQDLMVDFGVLMEEVLTVVTATVEDLTVAGATAEEEAIVAVDFNEFSVNLHMCTD